MIKFKIEADASIFFFRIKNTTYSERKVFYNEQIRILS